MATMKQSRNANMKGYQRAAPVVPQPGVQSPVMHPAQGPNTGVIPRSPYMLNSMPSIASTADGFQRQFYGGAAVPTYRILPPQNGANK
jgi:hypothetical protein